MSAPGLHIDIAIIGGGVAGLWLLNRLRNRGYSVVLLEATALGGGQSMHSQGIIHGGVKYGLDGSGGLATAALAAMPGAWRECLAGTGEVDLRHCKVMSEHMLLCPGTHLPARMAGAFAANMLASLVSRLDPGDYPELLGSPDFRGPVYRLHEPVLDLPSLIAALARPHADAIRLVDWRQARLCASEGRAHIEFAGCTLKPQLLLLTAGTGNAQLMQVLGARRPAMQRKPLQQVLLRQARLTPLFAHFLNTGSTPRLSISSHRRHDGELVWYLGGELATTGAASSTSALIAQARRELHEVLPWLDLGGAEWATLHVDRAEAEPRRLGRPGGAYLGAVEGVGNALVAWPIKLALCPELGQRVEKSLVERAVLPRHTQDLSPLPHMGSPPMATPCWDDQRTWAG